MIGRVLTYPGENQPKEWCQLHKDMVQKGQATPPKAQVERDKGAGGARIPNGLRQGRRVEGGEGYCRGDSGHHLVRVKEVVGLWGELWCSQKKSQHWKDQWLHSRKPNRGRERHLKSLARQAQVPKVTCFPLFNPSFYIYKWMESFYCEKYMGKRILASILSPENRKHLPFAG